MDLASSSWLLLLAAVWPNVTEGLDFGAWKRRFKTAEKALGTGRRWGSGESTKSLLQALPEQDKLLQGAVIGPPFR